MALSMPKANTEEKQRILLIEDYAPNVLVATTLLEDFGYDCEVASNGLDGIQLLESKPFNLVLMDVQMDGIDGFEATRIIREREKQKGSNPIRIIAMTAHALERDKERSFECGMDDYISKPFDPTDLKQKLEKYLSE